MEYCIYQVQTTAKTKQKKKKQKKVKLTTQIFQVSKQGRYK